MVWMKNNQETGTEPDWIRQLREHHKTSGKKRPGCGKTRE
jgi:hypothetical protein